MTVKTTTQRRKGLREQIIDATTRLLRQEGYDKLSLRRVAEEVGCSQMAMYRYFANKDALIQHLCVELYTRFTTRMYRRMGAVSDPQEQIRIFVSDLIRFAAVYPDHYSLIFLMRHGDPALTAERDRLGQEFLQGIRRIVQALLPAHATAELVDRCLLQILASLHGMAALLIAHPRAYGLTKERAIRDTEETVWRLLGVDYFACSCEASSGR